MLSILLAPEILTGIISTAAAMVTLAPHIKASWGKAKTKFISRSDDVETDPSVQDDAQPTVADAVEPETGSDDVSLAETFGTPEDQKADEFEFLPFGQDEPGYRLNADVQPECFKLGDPPKSFEDDQLPPGDAPSDEESNFIRPPDDFDFL